MTGMKKIHLAYMLLLFLAACGGKGKEKVRLEGEIKGLGDDTIYLYGMDRLYGRVDTLPVKEDKFSVVLSVDTLVPVRLLFGDGTEYPLFLDKGNNVRIKGNSADLSVLEVSGNLPNEELSAFLQEVKEAGSLSGRRLQAQADSFISNHPSSLVGVYLLDKYFVQQPEPDFVRIKRLAGRMTGELKDRPYMEALLERIQEEEKVAVGKSVPHFTLPNAEGKYVTRGDFKDQYLLVHFWASWNRQSREANASLREINRTLKLKEKELEKKNRKNRSKKEPEQKVKLALLGVSLDVDRQAWQEAIQADTLEWTQVCDFGGWNAEVVRLLAVHTLPFNLLITPTGRIEGKNLSKEEIADKVSSFD